jgi:signal transduction histidine kinase
VEVTETGESIRVRVEDAGNGFDLDEETDGFGLTGMRERVTLAGGTLEVKSAPGKGTSIAAVLPARHRQEESAATTTPRDDEARGWAVEGS